MQDSKEMKVFNVYFASVFSKNNKNVQSTNKNDMDKEGGSHDSERASESFSFIDLVQVSRAWLTLSHDNEGISRRDL